LTGVQASKGLVFLTSQLLIIDATKEMPRFIKNGKSILLKSNFDFCPESSVSSFPKVTLKTFAIRSKTVDRALQLLRNSSPNNCHIVYKQTLQNLIRKMPKFSRLIKFESAQDGQSYFADLGARTSEVPASGTSITGFRTLDEIEIEKNGKEVIIGKV
jgi:hypothetical protein